MATTRIATQPRVPRSPKSADSPHEVRPEVPANDPVVAQARAVADTIRQLGRGRVPRDLPNLPLFSDAAPSPPPPHGRPKLPSKVEGRKPVPRQSSAPPPPDLARHRRKCVVCNHPDREEIEEQFIEWRHPNEIANDFQIEEARYIRRHARALGLYARRRDNYLFTLENLLERSDEIELTAAAYIKAVRAYACMCDTVRWTEPAIRVIGVRDSSVASQDRVDKEEQVSSSSSLLPQAALNQPAAAEQTPPSGPSGAARSHKYVATSASFLPEAALDNPATAKPSPTTHNTPHFQGTASAARLTGVEAGASAPKGSAPAPLPASQLEDVTLSGVEGQAPSNRPSPRLETGVSDTKQKKEAIPNRPQNAK